MKIRYVFLIIGAVLALGIGGLVAQSIIAEARLTQYGYVAHDQPTLIIDGVRYRQGTALFQPIENGKKPFGVVIGRYDTPNWKEYLYWVDEPGGDWISSKSKSSNFHFRRKGAIDPEPEDVTVYSVCIRSKERFYPKNSPSHTVDLLQDEKEIRDFIDFLLNNKIYDDIGLDMWAKLGHLGDELWLLCEEYPRMAFVYSIWRTPENRILLIGFGYHIIFNEEFSNLIEEGLAQSP